MCEHTKLPFSLTTIREQKSDCLVICLTQLAFTYHRKIWAPLKSKDQYCLRIYSILKKKHVPGFTCFSDPQDRGYSGEKHYENMRRSTMENPTNVSDAYEVGARHSLAHWGSNHEQDAPGPCPPWSPSLVEMIRCYKRCCEEEVLRVIVAKPNLGLLSHMQLSQSTDTRVWWRKVQLL